MSSASAKQIAEKLNPTESTWVDPDDAPELSPEWFANAKRGEGALREIFGDSIATEMLKPKPGRVLGSGTKVQKTVRFDIAVFEAFKATGKGWQTRMNEALKTYLKEHPLNHV